MILSTRFIQSSSLFFRRSCSTLALSWTKNPKENLLPQEFVADGRAEEAQRLGLACCPEFISPQCESALIQELLECFGTKSYEQGHWDNAIQGYREKQVPEEELKETMRTTYERLKNFLPDPTKAQPAHIIDYLENAKLFPHIDSHSAGDSIVGLSLNSPSVMILRKEDSLLRVLLPPRSLYRMSGKIRQEWTHEINACEEGTLFNGTDIGAQRRLSLILRCYPTSEELRSSSPKQKQIKRPKSLATSKLLEGLGGHQRKF